MDPAYTERLTEEKERRQGMKTVKRIVRIIALVLLFTILLGSSALAGWRKDGAKWWYSYDEGGYAKNAWLLENNDWYYFGNDGYMVTGWQKIGSWYHFNDNGKMDTGWIKDGGAWYYLDGNGAMVTGWQEIGNWYHFNAGGKMDTGWINDGGSWYYLDPDAGMVTGWRQIDGAWYYFDESGKMCADAVIDQKYYVGINGQWDGITRSEDHPVVSGTDEDENEEENQENSNTTTFKFHQDGWYIARLEVQVWDKAKQDFIWLYSDSLARGQKTTLSIDEEKYEINRVGYQIWFFGWNNDYMNLPWANTDFAKEFYLSGYGDYPEFTWN